MIEMKISDFGSLPVWKTSGAISGQCLGWLCHIDTHRLNPVSGYPEDVSTPLSLEFNYCYSTLTYVENAAVPPDRGWIFNNCTMSAQQQHVKYTPNWYNYSMPAEVGWILSNRTLDR